MCRISCELIFSNFFRTEFKFAHYLTKDLWFMAFSWLKVGELHEWYGIFAKLFFIFWFFSISQLGSLKCTFLRNFEKMLIFSQTLERLVSYSWNYAKFCVNFVSSLRAGRLRSWPRHSPSRGSATSVSPSRPGTGASCRRGSTRSRAVSNSPPISHFSISRWERLKQLRGILWWEAAFIRFACLRETFSHYTVYTGASKD